MENTKIGTATLIFTETGEFKQGSFKPDAISIPSTLLQLDLTQVDRCENVEQVQQKADEVFATWFSRMNEIELADREKYTIKSKVTRCVTFPSGRPQVCEIEYTFEKL